MACVALLLLRFGGCPCHRGRHLKSPAPTPVSLLGRKHDPALKQKLLSTDNFSSHPFMHCLLNYLLPCLVSVDLHLYKTVGINTRHGHFSLFSWDSCMEETLKQRVSWQRIKQIRSYSTFVFVVVVCGLGGCYVLGFFWYFLFGFDFLPP